MGVRILAGTKNGDEGKGACFYDSITDFAFGPVMDSQEEAADFLEYLGYPDVTKKDPRLYGDAELEEAYIKFRREKRGETI